MKQANENLIKITETLTTSLQTMLAQVTKTITDSMDRTIKCLSARVDSLESKLDGFDRLSKTINDSLTDSIKVMESQVNAFQLKFEKICSTHGGNESYTQATLTKSLWDMDREREERKNRENNMIVSGLPPHPQLSDVEYATEIFEKNLAIKPTIVKARRFGKDLENTKLCITFSNPETVKDLIQSSRLLRSSTDTLLRKVYLNKDMTT